MAVEEGREGEGQGGERGLVHPDTYFPIHSFIHSYSFIFSCQNATKHELGDASIDSIDTCAVRSCGCHFFISFAFFFSLMPRVDLGVIAKYYLLDKT